MTTETTLQADALIVGAGPVGLTLANLLGGWGIDVLLIERNPSTVGEPRAVSLDDESLRTMQSIGLADAVMRDLVMGYGVQYFDWRSRPFASILPTRQEYGYPKRNAFRQPLLEGTLREGLKRFGSVRALFSTELLSFEQDAQGVRGRVRGPDGESTVAAPWLVACDGGRSPVRERLGIVLKGATYAERWLIVDFKERTTPLRHTQTFCDPERPAIRLPGPHGTLRYEFMLRPGEDDAFALHEPRWREWVAKRCPADRTLPLVRKVVYTFHARVAERWREGRVFLAGDAAHLTPPFAGQGMNSGVRDAANLAWKLAAVLAWGAPASLLDTYEPERRPHAQALIDMALRIGHYMQPKSVAGALLSQTALRLACLVPAARDYILQLRFKPKPRFAKGFLDAATGAELLPQPMMDLPDRSRCLLDELLGPGFALIGRDAARLKALASQLLPAGAPQRLVVLVGALEDFITFGSPAAGDVVPARDGSGVLEDLLDRLQADALLVRPDRYWCRVARAQDSAVASPNADAWRLGMTANAPRADASASPHPLDAQAA